MGMIRVRLLNLGAVDWLQTQSIYHAVAESMTEDTPDTIILTRPEQAYLCIGYHQKLNSVLKETVCEALSLPVVRRRVGGGTTYLDQNQQFYQCVFHHRRVPARVDDIYARLLAAPIQTLGGLGLPTELRGGNEIEVRGKRIAGIGGGRIGEAVVVVGNLLIDFDYVTMSRVWHTASEDFRDMGYRAMFDRITTLHRELGDAAPSVGELEEELAAAYATCLGRPVEAGELTDREMSLTAELEERLPSEEWLHQHGEDHLPMTHLKIAREFFIHIWETELEQGCLHATVRVMEGVIEEVLFHEAWFAPADHLEDRLKGAAFREMEGIVRAYLPEKSSIKV
jgi:lipoate-protein ligase A